MPGKDDIPAASPAGGRDAGWRGGSRAVAWPGAWQAAAVAALSALAAGTWALTRAAGADDAVAPAASALAEVQPDDMAAALGTLDASPGALAQFRERDACARRIASVTVALAPGPAGRPAAGRIRLQSGGYVSPAFELSEVPVRVALPFPAPYPAGRGTISVLGTTADAVVALAPAWHVLARPGPHAQAVTWVPAAGCRAAGG